MENLSFCTLKSLNKVKATTLNPHEVAEMKQRFYIDTCKAVIKGIFQNMNRTDAFIQSTFYMSDLMDAGMLTKDDTLEIERYIHALSFYSK